MILDCFVSFSLHSKPPRNDAALWAASTIENKGLIVIASGNEAIQ